MYRRLYINRCFMFEFSIFTHHTRVKNPINSMILPICPVRLLYNGSFRWHSRVLLSIEYISYAPPTLITTDDKFCSLDVYILTSCVILHLHKYDKYNHRQHVDNCSREWYWKRSGCCTLYRRLISAYFFL